MLPITVQFEFLEIPSLSVVALNMVIQIQSSFTANCAFQTMFRSFLCSTILHHTHKLVTLLLVVSFVVQIAMWWLCETFGTVVTLVRLFASVNSFVRVQISTGRTTKITLMPCTAFSRCEFVCAFLNSIANTTIITLITLVRLFASVSLFVYFQSSTFWATIITLVALVRL